MPHAVALLLAALAFAVAEQDQGAQLRGAAQQKLSLAQRERTDHRQVTEVVRMLEAMLDKSKAEGDKERKLYAKYKCYCDDMEEKKTDRIEELTKSIELLGSQIEEIKSKTGLLSEEAADLTKEMEENELTREKLKAIREGETKEYEALKKDLDAAIDQLHEAIAILGKIGADQAFAAQGHTQYMAAQGAKSAGYEMSSMLQQALKQASAAAVALGKDSHAKKISAFIQSKAPFTETYSTQSGEIFGILADMRDTFESDLETATTKENKSEEMYQAIKTVLEEEHLTMGNQLQAAQGQLSDNDQELGTKKNQKQSDEDEKAEAEKFLSDLKEMCAEKASQYEKRVKLRSSEETALSQAIAILNSDMAFEAFGKVSATSFLQIGRRNVNVGKGKLVVESVAKRRRVDSMLRKAAQSQHSLKVARIASMVEAENPFTEVLEAITSMLAVIEAEGDNDQKNKEWCVDERKEKKAALKKAEEDITALKSAIVTLEGTIDSLKTDIQNTEEELAVNEESQTSQTAQRKEENLDYQSNVANLVEASELLKKAIVVLKDYYEDAMLANQQGTGFVQQKSGQSPTPPKTWDDAYVGQSEGTGGGKDAVSMLEFILKNTQTEESVAHEQENESQQRYEKEMQGLKEDEATLQSTLAKKQEDLAKSEEELLGKQKDLKTMEELAAKIEAYLLKIKPGCDFIEQNIAIRDRNRKDESDALKDARDMIMDTPVFKEAMATAKNETLGDCAGTCAADEDDVACKACVSKVSIPGYCAGHPGTKGCP